MFSDKDIANAVLEMSKHEIVDLTKAAMESSGALKQTLVQMRNQCEQSQDQLAQYAIAKGWYLPAQAAEHSDVQQVAGFYQQTLMATAPRL
jgi:spore coat protein CotF